MWSFYINMEKLILENTINSLIEQDIIRPYPLGYMRGASLDDCIIIADEMQNVSLDNSRTLLTRIGKNSKIILLGDINQIDIKNKKESSLEVLLNLFDEVSKIGVIKMSEEDTNIRNPLISVIEDKYNDYLSHNGKRNNKTKQLLVESPHSDLKKLK
jgi:phosphate starvation-inducible PhoH-like protein